MFLPESINTLAASLGLEGSVVKSSNWICMASASAFDGIDIALDSAGMASASVGMGTCLDDDSAGMGSASVSNSASVGMGTCRDDDSVMENTGAGVDRLDWGGMNMESMGIGIALISVSASVGIGTCLDDDNSVMENAAAGADGGMNVNSIGLSC